MRLNFKRKFLSMGMILMLGMFSITGCDKDSSTGSEYVTKGESSEEVYVVSFESVTTKGEDISSEIFAKSKLTMINVWATYCNPCLNEMPDLGKIAASYDETELQMIGIVSDVAVNSKDEDIKYANKLIKDTNANYTHILLNDSLNKSLVSGVDAVPTTFFVNQEGELLYYVVGANDKSGWEKIIDDIFKEIE